MEKFINEHGSVAVLISTGWGSGWSTSNYSFAEEFLFHPELVKLALNNDYKALTDDKTVASIIGCDPDEIYLGGGDGVVVRWLEQGEKFFVDEYDGHETLITTQDLMYTA